MSWQEFERLVDDAESDRELCSVLRHCRSTEDLILAARKLGHRADRWLGSRAGAAVITQQQQGGAT